MKLYNTLTRKKEEFVPLEPGKVKMYVCGPTVYNYIHIGNARPYVVFDTVRRYLEYKGYDVTYIQNFTDVDDKIIKKANEEHSTMSKIANRYITEAFTDADGLNVKRATHHPRVTEEMDGIIDMIQTLIDKGYAYVHDGTVYYDTKKFKDYGKLSKKKLDELIEGASERVELDEAKKNPTDFVLWKPFKPGEPKWQSPWGEGRPGWHIECSVMAKKYLGDTIDIHCGGEDLIFPHHENEIAQSEAATGKQFSKYWLHNAYIMVDNVKMSKSLGNFFTVREIAAEFPYDVIRFFILNGHYRSPLNFSRELLQASQNGLDRIKNCNSDLLHYIENSTGNITDSENEMKAETEKYVKQFENAMDDDFNTADAITAIYELVKSINKNIKDGKMSKEFAELEMKTLTDLTECLGINKEKEAIKDSDKSEIEALIAQRTEAKKNKDFAKADAIRDKLSQMGITIKDTRQGVQWFRS
ncbi:MAG: cysteine--tRNA ligase [Clostridia bacterium]|jgi:cysteinyl-tRNA synthetase|nr:cysteine--tRNA ligase [Clostridia bacterium]MCI2014453.1 cysteine--tRNA ligase [Clostridia bacterium]